MKKRKQKIASIFSAVLFLATIYLILAKNGYGIPCPIRKLTGFLCAGCGNTRATLSLLKLDIVGMLKYNLFFPLEMAYILVVCGVCTKNYLKSGKFSYHVKPNILDITFLISLLVWTVLRNII